MIIEFPACWNFIRACSCKVEKAKGKEARQFARYTVYLLDEFPESKTIVFIVGPIVCAFRKTGFVFEFCCFG